MAEQPPADENSEKAPVGFYHEKDLFGLERPVIEPVDDSATAAISQAIAQENLADAIVPESGFQSVKNFIILSFFSFGLYQFFWFYKHWRYLKDEKNFNITPGMRVVFIPFFGFSLFQSFRRLAIEKGYKGHPPLDLLFLIYVLILFSSFLHYRSLLAFLPWFAFLFLIPGLRVMNFYYLQAQPGHRVMKKMGTDEKIFLLLVWAFLLFMAFCS